MNKSELKKAIAAKAGITKEQAESALEVTLKEIKDTLVKGDKVALLSFGTWSITNRPAREGRNPQTGKPIQIAAKNVIKFKPSKELSDSVNA